MEKLVKWTNDFSVNSTTASMFSFLPLPICPVKVQYNGLPDMKQIGR